MKITSFTALTAAGLLSAMPALAGSLEDAKVTTEPPEPVVVEPVGTGWDRLLRRRVAGLR
ncbi:MAG: hypothetical protein RI538_11650 [Salibaculum sp.]|uniref:hypothetical protein n=1 Tax=Salibaculum sp. TaxID=2855480 RepID=UPI0028700354|nr:hypothetical protein [Salibaculum sp.]MDR9483413.1 hypothetical protein [Salibaculum sp.]